MGRRRLYSDEVIIKALEKSKGMVFVAAKRLGCHVDTIYCRADKSKDIQATIESERGQMIDLAEMKLFEAIKRREPWAIALTLKTIGKHRGYVERQEMTGADGANVVNWDALIQLLQAGVPDTVGAKVIEQLPELPAPSENGTNGQQHHA